MRALEGHTRIGWDIDGTLLDHRLSMRMHNFIHTHQAGYEHHLITFRTPEWLDQIWIDFSRYPTRLNEGLFAGIHGMPVDLADRYNNQPPPSRHGKVSLVDTAYLDWKAETCKKLGLTVLIDDMRSMVKAGCQRHGIVYLHPDDLRR